MDENQEYIILPQSLRDSGQNAVPSANSVCLLDGVCDIREDPWCDSDGVCWSDGVCQSDGVCTTQVPPSTTGTITSFSATSSSITIHYTSIARADFYEIAYRLTTTDVASMFTTTSLTATITGLLPNTAYVVNYRGCNSYGTGDFMSRGVTIWTKAPVNKWSWSDSNGSATAAQTRQFYDVLLGNALPENGFCYKVWNDFVDKVAAFRRAYGMTWNSNEGRLTQAACYVIAGDTMSAAKYNTVRYNIGSAIYSTGIQDVYEGDEITGYHIVHLTDVLNDSIDAL